MITSKEVNDLLSRAFKAKAVTESLVSKTSKFAQYVENAMDDLGLSTLLNGKYRLKTLRTSVGSDTSLYRVVSDDYYGTVEVVLSISSISPTRESAMLWGNYNAQYQMPCREDILEFINDAEAILKELADCDKTPDLSAIEETLAK